MSVFSRKAVPPFFSMVFLVVLLISNPIHSQAASPSPSSSPSASPSPSATPTLQLWSPNIALPNGARYAVDLNKVCSISLQQYVSRTLALMSGGTFIPLLGSPGDLGKDQKTVFLYADVTELTIETQGGIPARFYFLKEHREGEMQVSILGADATDEIKQKRDELQQLQKSILSVTNAPGQQDQKEKAQSDQATMVVKDYPVTTHARNIEFRLQSQSDVVNLYQNIWNRWNSLSQPQSQ